MAQDNLRRSGVRWCRLLAALSVAFLFFVTISNPNVAATDDTVEKSDEPDLEVLNSTPRALTEDETALVKSLREPHEFQAEVYRLMDIIINSLYNKKEVFLRELVSNAADALEKMRFNSVEDPASLGNTKTLHVVVEFDEEEKTITISDSGIGMTKQDLINNLGTVAKSGTSNFLEAIASGADINLIGQFGVGFYSAFLVADKVTVTSKHDSDDQYIWGSTADASFYVAKDPRGNTLGRGTRITLELKEDSVEFLRQKNLLEILKKYSQFVNFPIYLRVPKITKKEVPLDDEDVASEETDEVKVEEEEEGEKDKPQQMKTVEVKSFEFRRVNEHKPIWMRPKEDISEKEYNQFFKSLKVASTSDPVATIHFTAEGEIDFRALVFVPAETSGDSYAQYFQKKHDVKLYVRRVLIAEHFEGLIPDWLGFLSGVIDSDDLPLKVDRESITTLKVINVIRKRVTRKVLDILRKIANEADEADVSLESMKEAARKEGHADGDKFEWSEEEEAKVKVLEEGVSKYYDQFYRNFGRNLKLGCSDGDSSTRTKIAKLLRYYSTKSPNKLISLQKYIDNMDENQNEIYYISGDSIDQLMDSPLLQGYLKQDIEVLLLNESPDESCFYQLDSHEGKKLTTIEKGEVMIAQSETEKAYFDKLKMYFMNFTKWWKKHLNANNSKFSKVQLSNRLVSDPLSVVASKYGRSATHEKMMMYQTFLDPAMLMEAKQSRILEVNPDHPLIRKMKEMYEADENDSKLKQLAIDLTEAALLASGFSIDNPAVIAKKLYTGISEKLKVDLDKELPPVDLSDFTVDADSEAASKKDNADAQFGDLTEMLKKMNLKEDDENEGDDLDIPSTADGSSHDEL